MEIIETKANLNLSLRINTMTKLLRECIDQRSILIKYGSNKSYFELYLENNKHHSILFESMETLSYKETKFY